MKAVSALDLSCLMVVLALCSCSSPGRNNAASPANQANVVALSTSDTLKISIGKLLTKKQDYKGRRVEVTGYYTSWFEGSILRQTADASGDVSLWIDSFHLKPRQADSIKWVDKGFVRVIGTFDYRDGYRSGHMGMCPAEITQVEVFEALK